MYITDGIVEQHIHGAFGYDFMNCSVDDICLVSEMLLENGVTAFFPTVMTDSLEKIKERIEVIKEAKTKQQVKSAQIVGIHLEGPFINPEKAGIHEKKYILPLKIDLFKELEDEIIKIVTLAPELDKEMSFIKYLKSKNIKISAGHSVATAFSNINQVTHLYNAMGSFCHRGDSTVVSALINDNIYTEIIADSMHVSDDVLKITFKQKPLNKVLLISDALPLAHSQKKEQIFAGQKIYNKNGKLINSEGVFAGSSMLLCDIIKNLTDKNILKIEDAILTASSNQLNYHKLKSNIKIYWNNFHKIEKVEFI